MRSIRPRVPLVFGLLILLPAAALAVGPLRLPPDDAPPALAALLALDGLDRSLAISLSDDGALAAGAFAHPKKGKSSLVRITWKGGVREIDVRGAIVALQFDASGRVLYAVANRPAKKGPSDAWLVTVDIETGKSARAVTLPTSARDLGRWIGGGALLVACRDEIRTVLLPQVRSGPLFWIGGDNLAVASLAGGDLTLVGQEAQLLLVNLSDPQGRDQLPVRERVSTPASVVQIAAAPDGSGAAIRLADGRTYMALLDPLRLEPLDGSSAVVLWPGRPRAPEPPPEAPAVAAEPSPEATDPGPAAVVPFVTETAAPSQAEPPAAATTEAPPTPEEPASEPPEPAPAPTSPPPGDAEPADPMPAEPMPAASADLGELRGLVTGAEAAQVVAIVVLGPDNILREANRIEPQADGSWLAVELEPGRYRVMLDGGGRRILLTEPSFRTVEVRPGVRTDVEPIEALRVIDR